METDDIFRTVIDIARRHMQTDATNLLSEPITPLADIGLDSLKVVGFVLDVEAAFSIQFPADMLDNETLYSLQSVANAVRSLR